jgi:hypothetical protein
MAKIKNCPRDFRVMEGSSQRYINFIANLIPIYQPETVNDLSCARSLRDGTLTAAAVRS